MVWDAGEVSGSGGSRNHLCPSMVGKEKAVFDKLFKQPAAKAAENGLVSCILLKLDRSQVNSESTLTNLKLSCRDQNRHRQFRNEGG